MKKRYPFLPKNWLRFSLAAAFASVFSLTLQAQTAPAKQWDKTFGGSGNDEIVSLQQTTDGGYILGGYSDSGAGGNKSQASRGGRDIWVIKLDINGNKLWDRTFGGNNSDALYSVLQTTDGGYILGGWSASGISGEKSQPSKGYIDYWVLKLDANGNKLWDKTFGGNIDDRFASLQQTSDGGYILGGSSSSLASGDKSAPPIGGPFTSDYWLVKLDANGNKLWDKTFGGSNDEYLGALQQTSDGGYILGGRSSSGISGDKSQICKGSTDFWAVKLDAVGNKIWDKTFGGSNADEINCLQQTSDGGYILGGISNSDIGGDKSQACQTGWDYWIVKLDATGNKLWDKTFGGSNHDCLWALWQTSGGGYILGGNSNSGISSDKSQPALGDMDYWAIKLDSAGNKIWDKTLGGIGQDNLYAIQQTSDGGYILGGGSDSNITSDKSQISKGGADFWVLKLGGNATGLKEPEASFNLTISPNPNQGKFHLQLSNLTAPKAEVTISDLLGRVVLQKEIQTTNNQLTKELTLPNTKGIYQLQIKTGEQILTRKIVVE